MKRRPQLFSAFVLLLILVPVPSALAIEEPDRLWLVAEHAYADGLYALARHVLEEFVENHPRDARLGPAILLLGKARLSVGDGEAALEALRRAQNVATSDADREEARFWEAEALFHLKRLAEARALYDLILKRDAASPRAAEALYGFAWSELELGRPEAAVTAFRSFLDAWPEHARASAATFHLAKALVDLKRFNEALPLLADFPTKHPKHKLAPEARYLAALARVGAGDVRRGVADLRAFAEQHPSHPLAPEARRAISDALARQGDREELTEVYRALLAQEPATPEALFDAGAIAGRLGRAADRDAAWRKLRLQFPDHPLARRAALEMGLAAFKRKEWREAASLGHLAAQSPDDGVRAEGWLLAGEADLKQRRFAAAIKAFEAVGTIPEVEATVRYRALAGIGLVREEQQDWRAALAAYEAVAGRTPDPTLRDWARERAKVMKSRLAKSPAGKAPADQKPGGGGS